MKRKRKTASAPKPPTEAERLAATLAAEFAVTR